MDNLNNIRVCIYEHTEKPSVTLKVRVLEDGEILTVFKNK